MIGPAIDNSVVSPHVLPIVVRQTALNACKTLKDDKTKPYVIYLFFNFQVYCAKIPYRRLYPKKQSRNAIPPILGFPIQLIFIFCLFLHNYQSNDELNLLFFSFFSNSFGNSLSSNRDDILKENIGSWNKFRIHLEKRSF